MDFFTSLLKTYENAEAEGLVDSHTGDGMILLPIYHTSLKSNGKNIIRVRLDKRGGLFKAELVADKEVIIFPVTPDSVARSGKFPMPHPLVDKISYFLPVENPELSKLYREQQDKWIDSSQEQVKEFLEIIRGFIQKEDFLHQLLYSILGGEYKCDKLKVSYLDTDEKEKSFDLAKCFLDFSVIDFIGYQEVSVTNFVDLHRMHIQYVETHQGKTGICNISGRREVIASKHRGVMGNAKLISVSNNIEMYKGRFREREDIISVGNTTSEKIHLMLRFFLENEYSNAWLGASQYLINWFSDDLWNASQLDITKPSLTERDMEFVENFDCDDYLEIDDSEEEFSGKPGVLPTAKSQNIRTSFIKGNKEFSDSAHYYVAILSQTSNGRVALKYFRELPSSELLKRLDSWQDRYSWKRFAKGGSTWQATPTFYDIILATYGIDRGRFLELDNDKFKSDQYQQLVTALIDGKKVPATIIRKLEDNVKQRQKYEHNWNKVLFVALALLQKQHEEEYTPMLDKGNTNRSYLFGRLLAIFELFELQRYKLDGGKQERITNAERYWTAYASQPAKLMENLSNKIKPYEEVVKINSPGIFRKLETEREEVIDLLHPFMESTDFNAPLDYRFIFGYYAEKQFFYTKQEKNEGEE